MNTPREISNSDDIIDVRDVIARFEAIVELMSIDEAEEGLKDEHATLGALLDELKGYGGDEQWLGDWYPVTLIRDSYFTEYAQELCEDIGDVPDGFPSYIEIDWNATARNIRVDYSSVKFDGITYWYR